MYRIDDNQNTNALPADPTDNIGTPGYFTGGNPGAVPAVPPTRIRYWWLNMIQEELAAIVEGVGMTLAKDNLGQVFAAIKTLLGLQSFSLLSGNGWKRYPDPNSPTGFYIEQWGTASVTSADGGYVTDITLPRSFPNAHLWAMANFGGTAPPQGGVSASAQSQTTIRINVNAAASSANGITYHCKGY